MAKVRLSKNQLRRDKLKKKKLEGNNTKDAKPDSAPQETDKPKVETKDNDKGIVPILPLVENKELFEQYESVLQRFTGDFEVHQKPEVDQQVQVQEDWDDIAYDSDNIELEEADDEESERQKRKQNKVSIAHLKLIAKHPEVVEWCDIDARYPEFLISIKDQVNIVPVPSHWSAKREYLSGKRGVERLPFQLPLYIIDTGIQDMRNSANDLTIKQQQREKVQPKMGKLDIDYQKLHNAFFKYQTRPKLFGYGDLYYEGRENISESEEKLADVKPGILSVELLRALGLPENGKTPPPWISSMVQMGKPPSYSHLLIPGVDMTYANIGYLTKEDQIYSKEEDKHWGEVIAEQSSSEDEEEEEEEEQNTRRNEGDDNEPEDFEKADPTFFEIETETDNIGDKKVHKVENSNKPLYTIIRDDDVSEPTNGLINQERRYKFDNDSSNDTKVKETEEKSTSTSKKFKF